METKYLESGKIEELQLNRGQTLSPFDGHVKLSLTNRVNDKPVSLDCFIYDGFEKWEASKKGDAVLVRLVLLNWEYRRSKSNLKTKSLRYLGHSEYNAEGEILELKPHPSYEDSFEVTLDCGMYLITRISKSSGLMVGNYVNVEGRLDAHIVGKVN